MLRAVISLHGIRTRGVWQKELAPLLAREGLVPFALDYGRFDAWRLLLPWQRARKVEWLLSEYQRVCNEMPCVRPSIIAHSFGAFLVAALLEKHPQVKFDKVILCGSIASERYDWTSRFQSQVNVLHNEYGRLDPWPRLAKTLIRVAGNSGATGFLGTAGPRFSQQEFQQYGHSDYFNKLHFRESWLPILRRTHLADEDQARVQDLMDLAIRTAARTLGGDPGLIRANYFCPGADGQLSIPPGLHFHMAREEELGVRLESGVGSTGIAHAQLKPIVALLENQQWGSAMVPSEVERLLDPRLRWIVSMPVPDPDHHGGVLGILNLDGLDREMTEDTLRTLLNDLKTVADKLAQSLKAMR